MNCQHREIRARLSAMAPHRAIEYVQSFQLRPEETAVLIECDVQGLSRIQAANNLHLSLEAVKNRRRQAYAKIVDEINHREKERRG